MRDSQPPRNRQNGCVGTIIDYFAASIRASELILWFSPCPLRMSRVKAIYRSWAIPCTGKQVYAPQHRAEWLAKLTEPGARRRAEFYYQQLDALRFLRREVRRELLEESKKNSAWKQLCQIPLIGPIRAAVLLGILQTPHRFRTKRQLWTFGLIR